jgi:hypothetical protein
VYINITVSRSEREKGLPLRFSIMGWCSFAARWLQLIE